MANNYSNSGVGATNVTLASTDNAGVHTPSVGIGTLTLPTTTIFGQKTVTTAGTEVTLGSTQALLSGVTVKAEAANTGLIYVGTGTFSSTDGFELAAAEQIFIEIDDIASVSVDSAVNGEGVRFIGS